MVNILSLRFLPNIWGSSLALMLCLALGLTISLISNKVFLVWLGLELKMFGIMPFLNSKPNQTKKTLFLKSSEIKVSFYYFFVQVVGSLFFMWGSIIGSWFIMSVMGLAIKMGVTPFFWWVPSVISRLDWFSIGVMSTIQKMPGVLLFRLLFDLDLKVCLVLGLIGFGVSVVGMKFSSKNMKQLMAWSSISKMSMLMVLMVLNINLGIIYYVFYSFLVLIFCAVLSYYNNAMMSSSLLNGKKNLPSFITGFLLLIFSGLPPFVSFLLKVYFLSGFYLLDSVNMILEVGVKGKSMSFFYMMGKNLDSWNMVLLFMSLMVLQSIGYIKAFMNMTSTGSSRLSSSGLLLNLLTKFYSVAVFLMYSLSIILIWV